MLVRLQTVIFAANFKKVMITFSELGLDEKLVQATDALGFVNPTTIQEKAIPILLSGTTDMIGLAQTGTGKTAAFGLPLLQLVDEKQRNAQALVICPTRELCMQIVTEIELFKKFMPGMNVVAVYGGTSISMQIRDIRRGVQIVVATPGRLIDLIERKAINLEEIKYVVLDEADEMLNMGFQEDIEFILPTVTSCGLFIYFLLTFLISGGIVALNSQVLSFFGVFCKINSMSS